MEYKFLNIFFDKKDLLSQGKDSADRFLIENNTSQIEKIQEFFQNDSDVFCVNGFLGTGKAHIVDYSLSFLSPEVIVLNYECFDSTVLDDILLSFFAEFKKLSSQKVISEPKIRTENFAQKINSYFSSVEKPFMVILNSLESILPENRQEVLDFILHLSSFSKVKIILISKTFESSYLKEQVKYDRITCQALEKNIFEKYLKAQKINFSGMILDEFYKYSRGYYFYLALSVKIMQNKDITLVDFLAEFNKSFMTFDNYLKRQILDAIHPGAMSLFKFLAALRHPVNKDLLKTLNMYEEEKIETLTKNLILTKTDSLYYVKDYFVEQEDLPSSSSSMQKLHQFIIDLYQTQLPLKPLERNILISRNTMRKEIEYHSLFLPKKPKNIEGANVDINYLAYAKGIEQDWGYQPLGTEEKEEAENTKPQAVQTDLTKLSDVRGVDLNVKDLPFKLSKEELELLDENKKSHEEQTLTQKEFLPETQLEMLDFKGLINLAGQKENDYHYLKAIDLYKKALELETEADYKLQLPMIYIKIAQNYQKIADAENAVRYYSLARELYEKSGDFVKANYIKLSVSKIFYDAYQFEKTAEVLLNILNYQDNPPVLKTKTYLQLANLEINLTNTDAAFDYYKKAIEFSNDTMDLETLSELYFKYALILDDKSQTSDAIEFYEKCINLKDDLHLNKFLSSAYSNLATLYLERGDNTLAAKNYLRAYEEDKKSENHDGMYYSATKLANAFQKKYPEEALKFLNIALESAKKINDIFYIASASLAVGDFYYDRKEDEKALTQYIYALELVKNDFSKDNIDKIKMRINDIKFRLGEERFEYLEGKIKEGQSE